MSDGKTNGDNKNMRGGNGDTQNTSGAAPKTAAYLLSSGAGATGLTNYRILTSDGSIVFVDGGPLGSFTIKTGPGADKSANGLWRWVQKSGNDSDPGSVTHPKLTFASTNTSLLAALPPPAFGAGGRVDIGPGAFTEVLNVLMNMIYVGSGNGATLMTSLSNGLTYQSSVTTALAVIKDMNFINSLVTIDTSVCPGVIALFDNIAFSSGTTIADPLVSSNIMNFVNCFFDQAPVIINGGSSITMANTTIETNLTVNSNSNEVINVTFANSSIIGNVAVNYTAGDQTITLDLSDSTLEGTFTVVGTGVCAAGSVNLKMPLNYSGNVSISGTAGFCVINDNGNTASALVAANGTDKATLFASPAGSSNQTIMRDNANNLFYDYVRAWYLTVAGGGQVILVQDPSSLTVGNTLQITSSNAAAFQPPPAPTSRFTSVGFQYKGNWNYTYTASGGNVDIPFSSMNGGLAPDTYGSFDPLSSFVVSAAAMASILITTTGTQVVKFSVSGSLSYGFGTTTDDNATYQFQLKQAGSSLKNLSVTNAVSLYNNQLLPAGPSTYANMSGTNTANITAGTSLYELFLEVSGSDNAAHNLVFNNIEFRIEVWN